MINTSPTIIRTENRDRKRMDCPKIALKSPLRWREPEIESCDERGEKEERKEKRFFIEAALGGREVKEGGGKRPRVFPWDKEKEKKSHFHIFVGQASRPAGRQGGGRALSCSKGAPPLGCLACLPPLLDLAWGFG